MYQTIKWTMMAAIAFVSMARAQNADHGAFNNGNYSSATLRQMTAREDPRMSADDFNLVFTTTDLTKHKSIAMTHLPTKLMPPDSKSVEPSTPSKPDLPPAPPPPVTNLPPPVTHLPPPVTHLPPPVANPPPPVGQLPPPGSQPPPSAPPTAAPEIDARSGLSALAMLVGGLLVLRGGRSRKLA